MLQLRWNETICHDAVKVLANPITCRKKGHVIDALAWSIGVDNRRPSVLGSTQFVVRALFSQETPLTTSFDTSVMAKRINTRFHFHRLRSDVVRYRSSYFQSSCIRSTRNTNPFENVGNLFTAMIREIPWFFYFR